jgi:hypothetical protein
MSAPINPAWDADTMALLYRQGAISPNSTGWTEAVANQLAGVEVCSHAASTITHMLGKCFACGIVHTTVWPGSAESDFVTVRQGLLDAESVIEAERLSPDVSAALRAVPRCTHPKEKRANYRCGDGNPRQKCGICGRIWSVEDEK